MPAVLLLAMPLGAATPVPLGESLAGWVPADVGLFIEGRHLDDLLLPLTDPQAWTTLSELAGQPADVREAADWRVRIQQTVQMTPAEAIDVLFSEQFAFVGEGPGRAQDAVVLCRPTTEIKTLLERWRAQPLPTAGRTSVYRLPHRVGLALPHELVMFGDAAPAGGMFRHVLEFADADGRASLADDPVYQQLLAQAPDDPDAVLFARLGQGKPPLRSASQPASGPASAGRGLELPGPLRGASNILLALHRRDGLLHFSAVSDGTNVRSRRRTGLKPLVEHLPARTLAAWALHVDYPGLLDSLDSLPEQSVLRIALRIQQRSGTTQRLADALDTPTCVAVGVVDPSTRVIPAPPVPAVAVLVAAREPGAAAAEMDTLLETTASIYNLIALKVGSQPALPKVTPVRIGSWDANLLDLTGLVRTLPGGATIAELHVCWALDGDVLIVASHADWLRQILAARHGQAPQLSGMLQLSQRPIAPQSETIVAIQTGPIADLGEMWLAHLAQTAPYALHEGWWRQRQPGGENVRLGIQVTELPEEKRLRVTSVAPDMPADGVLEPGDEIVGCNRRRFATSQPVREIRRGIARRGKARWVDLLVERGGMTSVRRVSLPFVDPVQTLRRAVALGKIGQRVVYHDDVPGEAGLRGFLTIELRKTDQPLFPLRITPAEQPADEQVQGSP